MTFFFGQRAGNLNELVFEDIPMLGDFPLAPGFILGIVLHPAGAIYSLEIHRPKSLRLQYAQSSTMMVPGSTHGPWLFLISVRLPSVIQA